MKLISHLVQKIQTIAIGIFFLFILSTHTVACEVNTIVKDATLDEITTFFKAKKKDVVTFMGYSGLDYEDRASMLERAGAVLDGYDPSKTLINIGATPDGIGAVYDLAKSRGFTTTGIVSTQAKKYEAELSPCVDFVFYVEDATWGGFLEGDDRLSPTSKAMVQSSTILIGIGGGDVARDEMIAAKRSGKEVRFIPADMNHEKARAKAHKKGLVVPANFGGSAGEVFNRL